METKLAPDITLAVLGLIGLGIAGYIRSRKRSGRHIACPLDGRCDQVVTSQYGRFLGIPVELLGVGYYGIIVLSYAAFAVFNLAPDGLFVFGVITLSAVAFLFSLYLTTIQLFTLRQICTWCLVSAAVCAGILGLSLVNSGQHLAELLDQFRFLIRPVHLLGFALGLGAATCSDIFFFRFLKDGRISPREAGILHYFSQVIWCALALIVLSGIGLYLPNAETLNESGKFLAKMSIVGILILNGALLSIYLQPKLPALLGGEQSDLSPERVRRLRRLAFAGGAVSATSWYAAFLLGAFRSVPLPLEQILLIYLAALAGGVLISQVAERLYARRAAGK